MFCAQGAMVEPKLGLLRMQNEISKAWYCWILEPWNCRSLKQCITWDYLVLEQHMLVLCITHETYIKNMRFLCYLIVVKLSLLEAQSSLVKSKFRVKSMVIGISGLNWWNPNFCWKTESSTRQAAFHPTQVSSVPRTRHALEHRSRDHRLVYPLPTDRMRFPYTGIPQMDCL